MSIVEVEAKTTKRVEAGEGKTTRPRYRGRKKNKMADKYEALRKKFKVGDWVFGIGEHKGCSEVFEGYGNTLQPFDYLNDFNPDNYRLATEEEKLTSNESFRKRHSR